MLRAADSNLLRKGLLVNVRWIHVFEGSPDMVESQPERCHNSSLVVSPFDNAACAACLVR